MALLVFSMIEKFKDGIGSFLKKWCHDSTYK